MSFDLSPDLATLQARARELAVNVVRPLAHEIDASGVIAPSIRAALDSLAIGSADALAAVVMVEELAVASGAVAASAGLAGGPGPAAAFAGLRGAPRVETPTARDHLVLAGVCVGIGRAALAEALDAARVRGDRPAGDPAGAPHWALADAATELDAARLLLHASAAGAGLGPTAVLVFAAGAATRAVDAALRVVGADGYRTGALLERCARDARSACLLLGTEDAARRAAADALLA